MDDTNPEVIIIHVQLTNGQVCKNFAVDPLSEYFNITMQLNTVQRDNTIDIWYIKHSFLFSLVWQVLGHSVMDDNFIPIPKITTDF